LISLVVFIFFHLALETNRYDAAPFIATRFRSGVGLRNEPERA